MSQWFIFLIAVGCIGLCLQSYVTIIYFKQSRASAKRKRSDDYKAKHRSNDCINVTLSRLAGITIICFTLSWILFIVSYTIQLIDSSSLIYLIPFILFLLAATVGIATFRFFHIWRLVLSFQGSMFELTKKQYRSLMVLLIFSWIITLFGFIPQSFANIFTAIRFFVETIYEIIIVILFNKRLYRLILSQRKSIASFKSSKNTAINNNSNASAITVPSSPVSDTNSTATRSDGFGGINYNNNIDSGTPSVEKVVTNERINGTNNDINVSRSGMAMRNVNIVEFTEKQKVLLRVATKQSLLMVISFILSIILTIFFVLFAFVTENIDKETERIINIIYALFSMICFPLCSMILWLTFAFANQDYMYFCRHCDHCCMQLCGYIVSLMNDIESKDESSGMQSQLTQNKHDIVAATPRSLDVQSSTGNLNTVMSSIEMTKSVDLTVSQNDQIASPTTENTKDFTMPIASNSHLAVKSATNSPRYHD